MPKWRNGRRGGLKIRGPQGRVSSNLTFGTTPIDLTSRPRIAKRSRTNLQCATTAVNYARCRALRSIRISAVARGDLVVGESHEPDTRRPLSRVVANCGGKSVAFQMTEAEIIVVAIVIIIFVLVFLRARR